MIDLAGSSDQHSNSVDPLPGAVDKLSDPTFKRILIFPFIGAAPERFKVENNAEGNWVYMGRTKFKELLQELKKVRRSGSLTIAWLYGTQGYGKSYLLAALVCYLAAQDERVVYIPDCREWLRNPVEYIQKAMLFAWADDITTQKEIMTLNTEDGIEDFITHQKNVVVVCDQLNALTKFNSSNEEMKKRAGVNNWLMRFTADHKSVFSASANYREYLTLSLEQTTYSQLRVYGGLDRVSHRKIMSQ